MPSLLIVTEKFDVGGLETYIRGQVSTMVRAGWRVFLACGGVLRPELLPSEITDSCQGLPLDSSATAVDLLNATSILRQFMQDHGITHVHAHPFTSLFPALLAARLEGLPYVATLHGPSSLHSGHGPFNDFLLGNIVLPQADQIIAVSEEVGQLAAPYLTVEKLVVQANAIDPALFRPEVTASTKSPRWLLVSRLDAFKIVGIREFTRYAHAIGLPGVDIAGEGPAQATLQKQLTEDGLTAFVQFLGARADIPELMRSSAGVAGMGRVLLEGLASGRPCCLVGYDGVKGIVDLALFNTAAVANFSGRNLSNVDSAQLNRQLHDYEGKDNSALARKIHTEHAETPVWEKFSQNIMSLSPVIEPLFDALYCALRTELVQADRRPYLYSDTFFHEVGRIIHGVRYFSPSLAAAYVFHMQRSQVQQLETEQRTHGQWLESHHAQGRKLESEVAQLSEQLREHLDQNQKLRQNNNVLQEEINALRNSRSWRVTKPFRYLSQLLGR
ncbi:glycosyltransferase [Bordetella petrii]|uniref:glycosyltransferase n=1 Tax=Bordetella petrii TaxID=94624 RepID=UPI0004BBF62D|nr:glycosyltransferase [Bordetella petrii]